MGNVAIPSSCNTMPKRLQYLAENYPERELFVFYRDNVRYSYTSKQLFQLGGKFASRLRHKYGFQRGDIIANTIPNSPERLITDIGITLAGCTCMNGQILLADGADFLQSAKNSMCRGVVLRPEDDFPAWKLLKPYVTGQSSGKVIGLLSEQSPDLKTAILVTRTEDGHGSFLENLKSSNEDVFVDTSVSPDDTVMIFTTSGSTGYSKLVDRTHAEALYLGEKADIYRHKDIATRKDNVLYSDRLLGWPGGYPFTMYGTGQKRIMMDSFYSHGGKRGDVMWNAICQEKCDVCVVFPLELDSIIKYIASSNSTNYKASVILSGAQPLKKPQLELMLTIGKKIFVGYGSTELNLISSGFVRDTNVDDFFCGKIPDFIKLRIVDDKGELCKVRQSGTIHVQSELKFRGYFNRLQNPDPNTIKAFTKDGWFDTEDIGYLDEDGNLYVMGRNKDTITYGSSVFYPGWMEAKLLQHPDIAEALILPVSDTILFHNICACVKRTVGSDLTEEKLKSYCEEIFVADLKSDLTPMPKFFLVYEHFPETASGKPDKQALRKIVEDKFGLVKPKSTL